MGKAYSESGTKRNLSKRKEKVKKAVCKCDDIRKLQKDTERLHPKGICGIPLPPILFYAFVFHTERKRGSWWEGRSWRRSSVLDLYV